MAVQMSAWMLELLAKVKIMNFVADDEPSYEVQESRQAVVEECYPSMPDRSISAPSLKELEGLDVEGDFTAVLSSAIQKHWSGTKRELCERALLLENTFYKIQAGRRLPGRDTLICLALALRLKEKETRRLLGYLGYGLSEHIKRDYIILRCLENLQSPLETNLLLEHCGLRLLGPDLD
ncbi:MAG: hypothetical protein M1379_18015 [Firmicutes bacterium]|nr:hypothetical protein [Bacillota bacterium]